MTRAKILHEQLMNLATINLRPLYLTALTKQLEGRDAEIEWTTFNKTLVRVWILSELLGRMNVSNAMHTNVNCKDDNNHLDRVELEAYDSEAVWYAIPEFSSSLFTAPFKEALEIFRSKVPELADVVYRMGAEAKARAFWITGVERREALIKVQRKLAEGLAAKQVGLREFIDFTADKAAIGLADSRLENVFRTNMMGAMSAGTHRQLTSEYVRDAVAFYMLSEARDNRTRGNPRGLYPYPKHSPHYQMDEFIERPNHPIWQRIWPPNGYQCRASISPVSWTTAIRRGWASDNRERVQSAVDTHNGIRWTYLGNGEYPDPGFNNGPMLGAA